jgi:exopolysaccharide biosynthesis polyprenyl glycosylphosphotransferase
MKRSEILFGVMRVPLDALCALLAFFIAYQLRLNNVNLLPWVSIKDAASTLPSSVVYAESFAFPGAVLYVVISMLLGLYALQVTRSAWSEIGRLLLASLVWIIAVIGWYFLVRQELFYSRLLLVYATGGLALFVISARGLLMLLQRELLRLGVGVRSVVTYGRHPPSEPAVHTLQHDVRYRYLGHVRDMAAMQSAYPNRLDLVLQTDPDPESDATIALIEYCRSTHVGYGFFPPVFADVPHLLVIERMGLLPTLRFRPTPLDGWGRVIKRAFDVVCSALLIVVLSPVLILVAIAVLFDGGFPIFYVSRRVGELGEKPVPVVKFRSMVKDAERRLAEVMALNHRADGPLFKAKHDPRVTKVGRFIRKWSLDELPQLFNVLAGHMSLVGPRPHLPQEVSLYTSYQRRVFAVRPGVTGLAQVSGRSDLTFDQEVALDLQYIEEWSLRMDLWILWRTLMVVIGRKGAD